MAASAEAHLSNVQPSATAPASEEEAVYTADELIARERALELEAEEAIPFGLGACTYDLGYIRQPIYACRTCGNGGVCAHCSLGCHAEHDLVELFHKRHFRCDCGTPSLARLKPDINVPSCTLRTPGRASPNEENHYTNNFVGEFCYCAKGKNYDPEREEETMYQCIVCEEWFHENCTSLSDHNILDSEDFDDFVCSACVLAHPILQDYISSTGFATLVPRKVLRDPATIAAGLVVHKDLPEAEKDSSWDLILVGLPSIEHDGPCVDLSETQTNPNDRSEARSKGETESNNGTQQKTLTATDGETISEVVASAETRSSERQQCTAPNHAPQKCSKPGGGAVDLDTLKELQGADLSEKPANHKAPRLDLFMGHNFRSRICRCAQCLPKWSQLPFVLDQEKSYSPPVSRAGSPAASLGLPGPSDDPPGDHAALVRLAASLQSEGEARVTMERRGSYERAIAALDTLPRAQLASTLEGYHRLRSALYEHLRPLAETGEVVTEAHIRAFFDAQESRRPSKRPRFG